MLNHSASYENFDTDSIDFSRVRGFSHSTNDSDPKLNNPDNAPRIFMMGRRRSGKSSIQKVVFSKMSPHETLFLEPTHEIRCRTIANNPLVRFQILDFPGEYDFSDPDCQYDPKELFSTCGALIFVVDAQDGPYNNTINYILKMSRVALSHNPRISFDIFIHKVDGDSYLSDERKIDVQRDIQAQLNDEWSDDDILHMSYYLTSCYDHSIVEAFSKVVQKLIPQLPFLENLMDSFVASSRMQKGFLFDVISKIYVSTDSAPVDMQTYELCSDMIDVVVDVSCIYGGKDANETLGFDSASASTVKLSNEILYFRHISKFLALVCTMRDDEVANPGLIAYNFSVFKKAVTELFDVQEKQKKKDPKRKE